MRFAGEVAIVTGAARGIGRATAERLAREGARVLAVDREGFEADTPGFAPFAADLASDAGPADVVAAARAAFGRLDILVNNAGIGGSAALEASDDAQIDRILGTNLRAVLRLTREALGLMSRPGGRIVNVGSTFGEIGFPRTAAYAAAKGGLAELTRQLVADLAPQGIRVNAVAPGVILTPMTGRLAADPWYRRVAIDTIPACRTGTPEDVAGVIAFLCSEQAAFVHGQIIAVDGGWLAARTGL